MSTFDLSVLLELVDQLTGPLQGPINALQTLNNQAIRTQTGIQQMTNGAGMLAGGAALVAPLALATAESIKFESAYADVSKVLESTDPSFVEGLRDEIIDLSTEIPIAKEGLAAIAAAAGQALDDSELARFTEDAAKMGVAFDIAADKAGTSMTGMRQIFSLTQDGVVSLGDAVNHLGNNMDAKAADIVDILTRAGSTGKIIGLTGQQVSALGATMLALKTPPEVAATGINALLMRMATAPSQAKPFQEALADIGMTAEQLKGWVERDAQGAIVGFLEKVRGSKDVMGTLSGLFGAEYADDISKLVGSLDTYKNAIGLVGDETAYAGSMQKEYAGRAAITENTLMLLKNTVFALANDVGDLLNPMVETGAQALSSMVRAGREFVQDHPDLARVIVGTVVTLGLLTITAGVTMTALGLFNVMAGNASAGLVLLQLSAQRARGSVIGLYQALILRATGGVPATAAQAALLTTHLGRARVAAQGLTLAFRSAAVAAWGMIAPILANPITWLVAAVLGLAAAFVFAWRTSQQFRDEIMNALAPLREAWAGLTGDLGSFLEALAPIGSGARWVIDQISVQFARLGGVWNAIAYGVGWVLGFILTLFVIVFSTILARVTDIVGGIVRVVTGFINIVVGLFTGDFDRVRLGASQVMSGLYQVVNAALFGLLDRLGQFVTWVREHFDEAWAFVKALGTQAFQVGADIIGGLIGGVQSRLGALRDTIANAASGVIEWFRDPLDINSPSRVFMQHGQFVMDGLALGIDRNASGALDATRRAALGVAAAAAVALPGASFAASSVTSPVGAPGATSTAGAPAGRVATAAPQGGRFAGASFHFTVTTAQDGEDFARQFMNVVEALQD